MTLLRTLINRRWRWATLAVLLGMVLLGRLGLWQLDRLQQRRASNDQLRTVLDSPPFELTASALTGDLTAYKNRLITVHGRYDFANQVLVLLQTWDGRAGAHLLTPMVLEGRETAVFIDRGWIPDAETPPDKLSQFDEPNTSSVSGYIALSETLSRQTSTPEPGLHWYRVDLTGLQNQIPYQLLPIYVVQSSPPEANTQLPYHKEREIDLSEGPHLSYAIQWFIFMTMLGGGYVAFVYNKSKEAQTPPAL